MLKKKKKGFLLRTFADDILTFLSSSDGTAIGFLKIFLTTFIQRLFGDSTSLQMNL